MTQIHILDKDINVAYNMATLIAYEQITNKAFDPGDLERAESRIALLYSAILSANGGDTVEMDDLLQRACQEDIRKLDKAVSDEMRKFYSVSNAYKQEEGEEDLPKNV